MTALSIADYERLGRVFVVAEVAQAHDGSLGILHSFIDAAASTGVDAIKFQIHIAEAESSSDEPFRTKFSYEDESRFEYWRRMSFSSEQWAGVLDHCCQVGIEFLATPFSCAAVDLLEKIGVVRYKVGSGDIANAVLIERLRRTGKEVILSTGLGTISEIQKAVDRLRASGVAVLQCTTKYPTAPQDINLLGMLEYKRRFDCPIGLSDHSASIYAGIAAVSLGASVIEAHITFDKRMFGPDAKASLTIDEFAMLTNGIRFVEQARGKGSVDDNGNEDFAALRTIFGRSLAVNQDLPAGHVIDLDNLEAKKPAGSGLPAHDLTEVIGKKLRRAKRRWDFLNKEDFE